LRRKILLKWFILNKVCIIKTVFKNIFQILFL
jgi:hypothetical protein